MSWLGIIDGFVLLTWAAAYTLGLVMFSYLGLIWVRTGNRRARITLILMVPFFLLVVALTLIELAGRLGADRGLIMAINQAALGAVALLIFSFPYFSHEMAAPGYRRGGSLFFGGLSLLMVLLLPAAHWIQWTSGYTVLLFTLFTAVIVYAISVGLTARLAHLAHSRARFPLSGLWRRLMPPDLVEDNRGYDPFLRSALDMALTSLLFLPGLILFDFFYEVFPFLHGRISVSFTLFPLLFSVWSLNLILRITPLLPGRAGENQVPPSGDDGFESKRSFLARQAGLSPREAEVLIPLSEGRTYKEIAREFHVSLATVKTHVNRIYEKTGSPSRAELIHRIRNSSWEPSINPSVDRNFR